MKDIKGFKNLFNVKIPCDEHFDYYIDVLSRTHEFKDINKYIELYENMELICGGNSKDYTHRKSNLIIEYLKSTSAYKNIISDNTLPLSYNKNQFKGDIGQKYLSIDLSQANWQVFKYFDTSDELPGTYNELLDKFDCLDILKYSKNFRQFIFGNLNPKKQQSIQAFFMNSLVKSMSLDNIAFNLVDFKNDEIIITGYDESIYDYINNRKLKFKMTEHMLDSVNTRQFYELGTDNILYKKLYNTNGNRFYIDIKKYVLNEPLDMRDLYFRDNGELAIWYIDKETLKSLLNEQ